jgi:hypothetical protein
MVGVLLAMAFVTRRTAGLSTLMGELRIRLLGIVITSLILGQLLPAIDNAAHAGGLAAGLAFGWLTGRGGVSTAAPWRRTLLPVALTAAMAAAAVLRLDGRENLRTEMAGFEALHTQAEADFRTARADVEVRRRPRAETAAALERAVLPALHDRQRRCAAIRLEAAEWCGFLARYEKIWRLRVSGLRQDDAARLAEADGEVTRALQIYSTRFPRAAVSAPE